jgi:hypothetical protein
MICVVARVLTGPLAASFQVIAVDNSGAIRTAKPADLQPGR